MPDNSFHCICVLLASMLVVVGCGDAAPPQSEAQPDSVETPNPEDPSAAAPVAQSSSAVLLDVRSIDEIDALVASHKGKFVVLDLWALW